MKIREEILPVYQNCLTNKCYGRVNVPQVLGVMLIKQGVKIEERREFKQPL